MLDRVQEGNNLAQKKIADSRKWRKTFRKLNADPESKYRPVASLTGLTYTHLRHTALRIMQSFNGVMIDRKSVV